MIFDRISLVNAYRALNYVDSNEGRVSDILFNKDSSYGTKTIPRFKDLKALKLYIDTNVPYLYTDSKRADVIDRRTMYNLLTFNVYLKDINTQVESDHAIFVNNIRNSIESVKQSELNNTSSNELQKVFTENLRLKFLKENAKYDSYITSSMDYLEPVGYISIIPNGFYTELINKYYKLTQYYDN
jgi:hypothetical protein